MTETYGPKFKAPTYHIGNLGAVRDMEHWPNGAPVGIRNKAARRIIRKGLIERRTRSRSTIRRARIQRFEDERLATNSHEAKRYHEKLRTERRRERRFPAWIAMWEQIGLAHTQMSGDDMQAWFKRRRR